MIRHVELASLSPSPISTLSKDILWHIFSLNADMYYPLEYDWRTDLNLTQQSAFDTTLITSRVCESWRNLLLESSSIWGRVLRMERLQSFGINGRAEIVRRTGDAPLHLMGKLLEEPRSSGQMFIVSFFRDNWPRVQKISILFIELSGLYKDFLVNTFRLPAPSLASFHLHSYEVGSDPSSKPVTLFSDSAPLLQDLRVDFLVNLQARWIVNLLTLQLESPYINATDAVKAIKQMPYLQKLCLSKFSGDSLDPDAIESESIPLLYLVYLHIGIGFPASLAIARGIKAAAHCTLSISSIARNHLDNPTNAAATSQILFRYVVPYFAFWNVSSLEVFITLNTFSITVLRVSDCIPLLEPHWFNCFRIGLAFYPDFLPTCNSLTLLEPFLQSDLSNVKMLNLSLSTSGRIIGLVFKSFSPSVEVLQTTSVTLRSLARYATNEPERVLSQLHTLVFRALSPTDDFKADFWEFYNYKKNDQVPIATVDLGEMPGYDWRFLEAVNGLKVIWTVGKVSLHYICGSGDEKKLNFGLDFYVISTT